MRTTYLTGLALFLLLAMMLVGARYGLKATYRKAEAQATQPAPKPRPLASQGAAAGVVLDESMPVELRDAIERGEVDLDQLPQAGAGGLAGGEDEGDDASGEEPAAE